MLAERVPFLDVGATYQECRYDIDEAVQRVLASGHYIGGPEVSEFEEAFATYCGVTECVAVSNGLDALTLALTALGVGAGDEVIVPSHTFIATWLAVSHVRAVPVPVDIDPATYNIRADGIERAITPRTRAVIAVHLYGQPCDLDAVADVAARFGLPLIEDAAQAHGARYRGKAIGGCGDLVCWSFYPGKNLGAFGDAGAITTSNTDLAASLRELRNYGSPRKYVHDSLGFNHRMDPIQAAVLRVKLDLLDTWNSRREHVAAAYVEGLEGVPGVTLPHVPEWALPSWHLFVIRVQDRDVLAERLLRRGIETIVHYPTPPHRQACYSGLPVPTESVAESTRAAASVLSLPMGPHLGMDAVRRVVEAVRESVDQGVIGTS